MESGAELKVRGQSATVNSVAVGWTLRLASLQEEKPLALLAVLRKQPKVRRLFRSSAEDEEEQQLRVELQGKGSQEFAGAAEFHFLLPRHRYQLVLKVEGCSAAAPVVVELETQPPRIPRVQDEIWRFYVGPEHTLGEWLGSSSQDSVWAISPDQRLMRSLWLNACFTLPSTRSPVTTCPNPRARYCLDLSQASPWLRGKKVRRHKADFCLSVNRDYRGTFQACARLHEELDKGGTWITKELVDALDACRREGGQLKVYSIELWEKKTGELAAAIMALSVGDIFHDYTTAAMKRDERSAGSILTKVVGHLLTECGYKLWYWGFKNPYMAEYDGKYAGQMLDNGKDFWPRWKAALASAAPCDLAKRVPSSLDLATL